MSVIEVKNLTKYYGKFKALDGIDLNVKQGEVFGFIGPNGAGKSTTLRVLLGLLKKNGGEVRVMGKDPWKEAVQLHKRLAYVPGEVNFWPNLTGGEVIDLLGRLRGGFKLKGVKSFWKCLSWIPPRSAVHILQVTGRKWPL